MDFTVDQHLEIMKGIIEPTNSFGAYPYLGRAKREAIL